MRGGLIQADAFPLTIYRIRPTSCADMSVFSCLKDRFFKNRNGCLKEGDRILAIDGVKTCGLTCEESMKLLAGFRNGVSLFIEYDVADIGGEELQLYINSIFL